MENISTIDTLQIPSAIQIVIDCSKAWEDLRSGKFERKARFFSRSKSKIFPNISYRTFEEKKFSISPGKSSTKEVRVFANLYGAYLISKSQNSDTVFGLKSYIIHYIHNQIADLITCLQEGSLYWEKENIIPFTNRKSMSLFEEVRPYIPQWYSKQNEIPLLKDRRDREVKEVIQKLDDFLKEIIKNYNDSLH